MTNTQKSKLVVVESPNKVATIEKILGDGFIVRATRGHIADIPDAAGAVDVMAGFAARYELSEHGAEVIAQLKVDLHFCDEVLLATDDDREGELIAAHVIDWLAPRVPVRRVVFHSVTKEALLEALATPRELDMALVEAARTRRVLDRLFGYEVTDVTRRKVRRDARAGRVQSPALRLVVEREMERMAFVPSTYRDVVVTVSGELGFEARLVSMGGTRVARGADFDAAGLMKDGVSVPEVEVLSTVVDGLSSGAVPLVVAGVSTKPARRGPLAPFTMSTLYQAALDRYGISVKEAEVLSEKLFAAGLITYPRTDKAVHDASSRAAIRAEVVRQFGVEGLAPIERFVAVEGKRVQGAHEAIRPTDLSVSNVRDRVSAREALLYSMVWMRTMASQMVDAEGETTTVRLVAGDCEFTASGTVWDELGWRRAWVEWNDHSVEMPMLAVGDVVSVGSAVVSDHLTQPPARFTESTLVREMEELGIGRPSTYAKIIAKLRERYVWSPRGERTLIPRLTAFAIHRLLVDWFDDMVDFDFTNSMEEQLDAIAAGLRSGIDVLSEFWRVVSKSADAARVGVNAREIVVARLGVDPDSGDEVTVRAGQARVGGGSPYVECGDRRVSVNDRTVLADLTLVAALELLERKYRDTRDLGVHPDLGVPVIVRPARSATGHYLQLGAGDRLLAHVEKPLFVGLPEGTDPASVDHAMVSEVWANEQSRRRVLGVDEDGVTVEVRTGRYGPYVERGTERRRLASATDISTVTLADALEVLAQSRSRSPRE